MADLKKYNSFSELKADIDVRNAPQNSADLYSAFEKFISRLRASEAEKKTSGKNKKKFPNHGG